MNLFVFANDLQKLDLPHPLLVDFHLAAKEVDFFLLERLLGEFYHAHEIFEEAVVFTVKLVCERLLVFLKKLEQFCIDLLLYVLEYQKVLFELDLDEVQRLMEKPGSFLDLLAVLLIKLGRALFWDRHSTTRIGQV